MKSFFSTLALSTSVFLTIASFSGPTLASKLTEQETQKILENKNLTPAQKSAVKKALDRARFAGTGVEGSTRHPVSQEMCEQKSLPHLKGGQADIKDCGAPWMAKIPGTNSCVDRFEYPNLPCSYPVTWVQANEAAAICEAEGKRLCDASEWEGACVGEKQPEDWVRGGNNNGRTITWSYGPDRRGDICGFGQPKSPGCDAAISTNVNVVNACGSNTWPSGSFPECSSSIGVYDQHGNAAEHMNLARNPQESTKNGGSGVTEMKGSWFVFPRTAEARIHKDDCTWREPGWHRTPTNSGGSHANYHLGFRCCKTAPN